MIELSKIDHIYVYPGMTDMRRGIQGLRNLILDIEGRIDKNSLYVFCGYHQKMIKIIETNDSSIWLYQNKLIRGKFIWPNINEKQSISHEELLAIIMGVSLVRGIENRGKSFSSY